ncbi:MAG: diacylglycerol kinase family protein [Novosphingobium sp.]
MHAPLPVLINRSGGTAVALGARLEETVRAAFDVCGRDIVLELLDGSELADGVRRHLGASIVTVGGGDGTLGGAAQILTGTRTALAILPLGTRNHLARQLGVPLDLAEAAKVAATGERRRMDLGRAGKRIFVNNASIGLYPQLVTERDKRPGPKWLGTIPAAWQVLRTMRPHHYRLAVDGEVHPVRTPLLFVGNNRYSLEIGSLGERESLRDGELSLRAVRADGPLQLARFALKVLLGMASADAAFADLGEARSITIENAHGRGGDICVAIDGEVVRMALPLQLDILPSALGVVAPRVPAQPTPLFSRTH